MRRVEKRNAQALGPERESRQSIPAKREEQNAVNWYTAHSPIRQKTLIAFGTLSGLIALIALVALIAGSYVVAAVAGIAFIVAGVLSHLFREAICIPYVATVVRMEGLAAGDLESPIEYTHYTECVGRLTKAMFTFRDAAIAQRKAAESDSAFIVKELGERLRQLTAGDLTAEITCDVPETFKLLKGDFNSAAESMRRLINAVMQTTAVIKTGSGEIAQASEDLARRTESNAASLEQTSAAISQMDERSRATAGSATTMVERADTTISTITSGRSVADEAVQAMDRVSESAKGIDSVIEGLDKIAFQTRVLAMNAAVEAGRAGEAGRGFAVVADLVSALAMRAEEEAKRARDQLTMTQTDIGAAVHAVERVDEALEKIATDVGEVHSLLDKIAGDNRAQASAIEEINAAIAAMDQSTQQNAAMVEQTSAAARNLSTEVAALADQASKFHVGDAAPSSPSAKSFSSPVSARQLPDAAVAKLRRTDTRSATTDWNAF